MSTVLRVRSRINRHIREQHGRRFCGRHTGPVAVEFTVFLRATLQPPLSTGVEHTLAVETISLSSLPTPMRALSWEREKESERRSTRDQEGTHKGENDRFSFSQMTCRIIIADFNHCQIDPRSHKLSTTTRVSFYAKNRERISIIEWIESRQILSN